MRTSFLALAVACALAVAAWGQQANPQQTSTPKSQSQKKQPAAQASTEPAESAKPDASEQKPAAPPAFSDKEKDKEEHYDMTEAP
ncbi:MAG: hypothetical protein WA254_02510, partial [Candidatus Sulfotelmatobacter sp.]